jgi:hypothetical protein
MNGNLFQKIMERLQKKEKNMLLAVCIFWQIASADSCVPVVSIGTVEWVCSQK